MDYDKIGNFIQQKRKEKDLTQKELAKKLYLTDKAVSKWERGLGCPDVSTLEKLSLVLDVSILSILNGEEIEDEDINNAVLKTVNYSKSIEKNKIKNYISNITLIIIFSIFSFLVYSNVTHANYLNKINRIEIDYRNLDESIKLISKIKKNIDIIKTSKLIFSSEDRERIIETLDEAYDKITIHQLYTIDKDTKYSLKEAYEMITNTRTLALLSLTQTVDKYNDSSPKRHELQQNYTILQMLSSNNTYSRLTTLDKYQSHSLFVENFEIDALIIAVDYRTTIYNIHYLTEYVIEVGVINE